MTTSAIIVQSIPVNQIADPVWNSRVTPEDKEVFAKFSESIKLDGIRTPLKVRATRDGKTFTLIYGSRRLRAAREVGLTSVPAIVEPPIPEGAGTQDLLDQMVENARENLARRDLSPYEQARTFSELRKAGMKLADVSSRVGVTPAHVSNLATIYTQADPIVITEWSKGNPAATTGFLRDLVSKEKDGPKQVLLFREREKQLAAAEEGSDKDDGDEDEDEDSEDDGPTRDAAATKFHVDKGRYRLLLKRLQATKSPAISIAAVKYLVGTVTKIAGVIEDEPKA